MSKRVRLLLLVNWEEKGEWSFYRRIAERFGSVRILQPPLYARFTNPLWRRCCIYLSEFYLPLRALCARRSCDIIVSWSMRMGVWYGLLNRLSRSPAAPRHIIYDFHINPTRADLPYRLRLRLLRLAVPGIDFFLCTSRQEAAQYSGLFAISPRKICFFPMTPPPHYLEIEPMPRGEYVLAYGNSDRDYDTLVRAATGLPIQVIILSQKYLPQAALPGNISLITRKTVGRDLIDLIAGARFVVLPLSDGAVSAGQTAMLETMALGRPLIVTDNPATREYAAHNESALFFPAGRADLLKEQMQRLLEDQGAAEGMGKRARHASRELPERQVAVFCKVVEQVLS